MSRAIVALASVAACLALVPARAHAYLDGARFVDPVLEGGAGGRFFTGAPGDGYGCVVCHGGGGTAAVTIEGLPEGGWAPGERYDLSVVFPEGSRSAGAVLEIADENGDPVGDLDLVPDAELEDADRCRDDTAAVVLAPLSGRAVARAEVCGARRLRARWTAPAAPATGVRLFASAVLGDDSGDPTGDPAITLTRPLRARGAPALEDGRLGQSCAARPGRGGLLPLALLALAVLRLSRR